MKTTKIKALLATATAFGLAITAAQPAAAQTKIVLNDIGGVKGSPAELGFKIAASYWESVLTSNVTLHFDVGFAKLGPNILGGTSSTLLTNVGIDSYYGALAATGTSALDATVLSHLAPLSPTGSVSAIVPNYARPATLDGVAATGTRLTPDGKPISNSMALSSANAQALGAAAASVDATIQFSNQFAFDFNPTDGIKAGTADFIGVAIHEMGHALGFLSGADDFDYSVGTGFKTDNYWWAYAADMFRYSGDGQLNWAFNQDSYFSIDGGATAFQGKDYFSTGENNGDGWQASHWKANNTCSGYIGVMNPYTCGGQMDVVTAADLALMDAIGWNVNVDVLANGGYKFSTKDVAQAWIAAGGSVPEPESWTMLILGFGAIGGAMRYRNRSRQVRFA
ncbi:PEP-CTERM protein-sorting domain-containing protein [Sphingomonas sp. NFR04]|uniref:NF038122 family metalloprotease n=1 Tax=Sphingomonas sp. NFR04 TaxID=1566283 RepID=UPI0008F18A49|nr:NF038122 family metalloprotease [Sphingomonas sp. NFR04]SFJ79538.1 PEP-CTERM protein-sorting domain-containing protein [Sphingomonas sp. NFR04]